MIKNVNLEQDFNTSSLIILPGDSTRVINDISKKVKARLGLSIIDVVLFSHLLGVGQYE